MVRLEEREVEEIGDEIYSLFYENIYKKLLDEFKNINKENSKTLLISAIKSGKIKYIDGYFIGKVNIELAKELSKYAVYDKKSKKYKAVNIPADIMSTIISINKENAEAVKRIQARLMQLSRIDIKMKTSKFESISDDIENRIDRSLAVSVDMNAVIRKKLEKNYIKNQNINIKNWQSETIEKMRERIQSKVLEGFNMKDIIEIIMSEQEVSKTKAKFLARQETSIFLSKLRKERSLEVGVRKYKWSTSHDKRVRDDHGHLDGKIFEYGKPPVTNKKTGAHNEPGEDFGCRCVAIPIFEE